MEYMAMPCCGAPPPERTFALEHSRTIETTDYSNYGWDNRGQCRACGASKSEFVCDTPVCMEQTERGERWCVTCRHAYERGLSESAHAELHIVAHELADAADERTPDDEPTVGSDVAWMRRHLRAAIFGVPEEGVDESVRRFERIVANQKTLVVALREAANLLDGQDRFEEELRRIRLVADQANQYPPPVQTSAPEADLAKGGTPESVRFRGLIWDPPHNIQLDPDALQVDGFHVEGQGVNEGPRGVRVTHEPTGLWAEATRGRGATQNRALAAIELRKKVIDHVQGELAKKVADTQGEAERLARDRKLSATSPRVGYCGATGDDVEGPYCGLTQYNCPGGTICAAGHGGAPTEETTWRTKS